MTGAPLPTRHEGGRQIADIAGDREAILRQVVRLPRPCPLPACLARGGGRRR